MWLFLLGEREEPPGEFPYRTANCPTERALRSPQVQVIFSMCCEQIEQVVFRVDNPLILREIVTPATLIAFTEIARVDGDQGSRIWAQRTVRSEHSAMQHAQEESAICA